MESEGIFAVTAKSMAIGRRSVGSYIPKFTTNQASRQIVKEPVKKEAPSTIVKARLQEESAWCRLGKQLMIFLQTIILLFSKFPIYMGTDILLNEENGQNFLSRILELTMPDRRARRDDSKDA
jgi:hypothetical protein